MRRLCSSTIFLLFIMLTGCNSSSPYSEYVSNGKKEMERGSITEAIHWFTKAAGEKSEDVTVEELLNEAKEIKNTVNQLKEKLNQGKQDMDENKLEEAIELFSIVANSDLKVKEAKDLSEEAKKHLDEAKNKSIEEKEKISNVLNRKTVQVENGQYVVGGLTLSMSRQDVESLWGKPDKEYSAEDEIFTYLQSDEEWKFCDLAYLYESVYIGFKNYSVEVISFSTDTQIIDTYWYKNLGEPVIEYDLFYLPVKKTVLKIITQGSGGFGYDVTVMPINDYYQSLIEEGTYDATNSVAEKPPLKKMWEMSTVDEFVTQFNLFMNDIDQSLVVHEGFERMQHYDGPEDGYIYYYPENLSMGTFIFNGEIVNMHVMTLGNNQVFQEFNTVMLGMVLAVDSGINFSDLEVQLIENLKPDEKNSRKSTITINNYEYEFHITPNSVSFTIGKAD